ncbi:MAG: FHA domain-containing protein, partial [Planctomycetales bacterium]|nr:FHA domain-containing protein [Planctomycetales bacterium]
MAKLSVIQGAQAGQDFDLRAADSTLGRSPECDIVLEQAAVSRRHAVIAREGELYFIRDNGSRNGTFVNQERVVGRRELATGDVITICDIQLRFAGPPDLAATAAPPPSPLTGSLLGPRVTADEDDGRSTIMAMIDVSGGASSSWHFSARPEVQLQAMVEILTALGKTLSVNEILPKLLDSLFKIFVQADRGFVIMRKQESGPLIPVAAKARRGDEDRGMRFSRTIVERAMEERQAILSADAATDERFNMAQSISDIQIRSLICAPLVNADGEALGVLQIDTSDQRSRFTDQDLQVLAGVASQAAIAMDNARMHEEAVRQRALTRDLEVAREMQRALLPAKSPDVPGYHFFQYYQAAYQVGGDYYDYVLLPDDRFAAVVGDVAGKGVSAAILMAKLSSDVRFWLARESDPAKALGRINAAFCR